MDKYSEERLKLTETIEKSFFASMKKEYGEAYREISEIILKYIAKHSKDGKFHESFFRGKKFDRMVLDIIDKMNLKSTSVSKINSFSKDIFLLNYYFTQYMLEGKLSEKFSFPDLKKEDLDGVSTLSKLAIQTKNKEVKNRIKQALTQAVVQGDGIGKSASKIRKVLNTDFNRSIRIARTETTTMMNEATLRSMERANKVLGIQKEWVATLDKRTRRSHGKLDGEIRDLDKPFSNKLMFPGDQKGPPEEVINCRCAMIERVKNQKQFAERRARNEADKGEVIQYKNYEEWRASR